MCKLFIALRQKSHCMIHNPISALFLVAWLNFRENGSKLETCFPDVSFHLSTWSDGCTKKQSFPPKCVFSLASIHHEHSFTEKDLKHEKTANLTNYDDDSGGGDNFFGCREDNCITSSRPSVKILPGNGPFPGGMNKVPRIPPSLTGIL